jgi:alpha-galactosidase
MWIWNTTDQTLRSKHNDDCLMVQQELEIWAGPLSGGSQAVVLLNRGDGGSSQITVTWKDIGFPTDHSAVVRDLWARKDIGTFTGSYTSPDIDPHAVMMLNITLTK